ncbi:unnamed protein product [Dibothriocephalus latus]|uniref:Uncharacterized protein n=1 Tax=Dibothriocephalus latus TaxID=60516 RepID=A0A3P7RNI3_DIBLA|nr:unnamed protein product [Dibothriocephalus latus]
MLRVPAHYPWAHNSVDNKCALFDIDDIDFLVDMEVIPALRKKMHTLLPDNVIQQCGRRDKLSAKLIVPNNFSLDA